MKFLFAASTLLAIAASQDLSSLPACGQMCVNNMLGLAPSLGCSATDAKCLCSNANFAHGLNDCSLEACGAAVQSAVVAFGTSYCSAAGVPLGGSGGSGGSGGTTAGGTGGSGGTATVTATATGSGGSGTTGTGGAATGSAGSSASSALSSAASSASGALASASSSINSALSSATKSASGSGASGSSSSSSGFAMHTAAPLAGAGALGLAAILLV